MTKLKQIKEKLKNVDSAKIFFTDLNGRHRSLPVNPQNIEEIIEGGIGFDGSSIAGITTVDDSDRLLLPVAESLRILEFSFVLPGPRLRVMGCQSPSLYRLFGNTDPLD